MACYTSFLIICVSCLITQVERYFVSFFSIFSLVNVPDSEPQVHNQQQDNINPIIHDETYEFKWSTSLIPRPLYHTAELLKQQLPTIEYSSFLHHNQHSSAGNTNEGDDFEQLHQSDECAVCLNPIRGTHLMRELQNCRHVFHRECLDSWIDKSNVTCPLCRADLLPVGASTDKDGELKTCRHSWGITDGDYQFLVW